MKLVIDGKDWGGYISPFSIDFYHEKVQGRNAGVSMGGITIFDTVRIRSGFKVVMGLLMQDEYSEFIRLCKRDYVAVTYDDPDTGGEVTREMEINAGNARQIQLMNGEYAYKNISLDFKER